MNLKNAKLYSIITIVLVAVTSFLGLVVFITSFSRMQQIIAEHGLDYVIENLMAISQEISGQIGALSTLNTLLGIAAFVFTILTVVEANKLKENRTPFILLIVGIFISILAIIGAVLLLLEIKKIEQTPPPAPTDNYLDNQNF